jgi:hypothetical protein
MVQTKKSPGVPGMEDGMGERAMWIVVALAVLYLSFFPVMYILDRREGHQIEEMLRQRHLRAEQHRQEIDEALDQWLQTLELPQLEDQMKRKEAARQLSTVLIEKLLQRQYPERISKRDLPS